MIDTGQVSPLSAPSTLAGHPGFGLFVAELPLALGRGHGRVVRLAAADTPHAPGWIAGITDRIRVAGGHRDHELAHAAYPAN